MWFNISGNVAYTKHQTSLCICLAYITKLLLTSNAHRSLAFGLKADQIARQRTSILVLCLRSYTKVQRFEQQVARQFSCEYFLWKILPKCELFLII